MLIKEVYEDKSFRVYLSKHDRYTEIGYCKNHYKDQGFENNQYVFSKYEWIGPKNPGLHKSEYVIHPRHHTIPEDVINVFKKHQHNEVAEHLISHAIFHFDSQNNTLDHKGLNFDYNKKLLIRNVKYVELIIDHFPEYNIDDYISKNERTLISEMMFKVCEWIENETNSTFTRLNIKDIILGFFRILGNAPEKIEEVLIQGISTYFFGGSFGKLSIEIGVIRGLKMIYDRLGYDKLKLIYEYYVKGDYWSNYPDLDYMENNYLRYPIEKDEATRELISKLDKYDIENVNWFKQMCYDLFVKEKELFKNEKLFKIFRKDVFFNMPRNEYGISHLDGRFLGGGYKDYDYNEVFPSILFLNTKPIPSGNGDVKTEEKKAPSKDEIHKKLGKLVIQKNKIDREIEENIKLFNEVSN